MQNLRIGIIGSGSWGTALTKVIIDNGYQVNWFVRNPDTIDYVKHNKHNPKYLRPVSLSTEQITFYLDINKILKASDILIFVVPSIYLNELCKHISIDISEKIIISAIKGIVPEKKVTISQYFQKYYNVPKHNMLVISGPCHAEEVAQEHHSFITIASLDDDRATRLSSLIKNKYISITKSYDILGIEFATIFKNITAIAAGICHAYGFGDNFLAVLVSNAAREINDVLQNITNTSRDFYNSVYLGDILVTCYSQHSRNRTFGVMIGSGYSVQSAQLEMNMIVEGYYATASLRQMDMQLPIHEFVYNIIYNNASIESEMNILKQYLR